MMTDVIGDMITRIRNGLKAKKTEIVCSYSKNKVDIIEVLKSEGYVNDYNILDLGNNKKNIIILLKYYNGKPAILNIKRISRPGLRIYYSTKKIPLFYNGLGISIISTSKGILSDKMARDLNVGGELICNVF